MQCNIYNVLSEDRNSELESGVVVICFFRSWCSWSSDQSIIVDPLNYFSLQPVLHDWRNKSNDMCYHVCGMVHITKTFAANWKE